MKQLSKKITALALLLGLILSSISPMVVLGADPVQETDGKITITNAKQGHTYTIYRVFDLTYDDTNKAYTYTAVTEALETAIKATGQTPDYSKLDSGRKNQAGRMIINETPLLAEVGQVPEINPYDFSKWLMENHLDKLTQAGNKEVTAEGNLVFDQLPLGYYLVKSSQGSIVSLNTTDKEVDVVDKNTPPSLSKKVQRASVGATDAEYIYANIGEELTFTLKFTVQEYGNMDYILTDILPAGLDYTEGLTVSADGLADGDYAKVSEFANTGKVTVDYNGTNREIIGPDNKILAIKFPKATVEKLRGKEVTVSYKAKLNESAAMSNHLAIANNKNLANLQYDTLKTDDENFGLATASADVRTAEFQIKKFKMNGQNEEYLAGAGFKIYDAATAGNEIKVKKDTTNANLYHVNPSATDGEEILPTDANNVTIKGLKTGTYYIEETTVPAGFNGLQGRLKLVIGEDDGATPTKLTYTVGDATQAQTDNIVKIENKTGARLPETGGMGRKLIYGLGGLLFFGSLVLLVARKKTREDRA